MTKHRRKNAVHREYIAWLHDQPCAACGTRQNIQAAHVGRGGTGMKHGSDAEAIPLCGPRPGRMSLSAIGPTMEVGCHAQHDQLTGEFQLFTREMLALWNATQIAAHRGRFEARNVNAQGAVPF